MSKAEFVEIETEPVLPPRRNAWTWLDEHSRELSNHSTRIGVLEAAGVANTATLARIEAEVGRGGAKIDAINRWLLASVFTLCLALFAMVVTLLRGGPHTP